MAAIKARDVEDTRRLLSNGADVVTIERGIIPCPLQLAFDMRDIASVKVLFDAGAYPDRMSEDILTEAVYTGDEDIVRYLLEAGVYVSQLRHAWINGRLQLAVWKNPHILNILVQYGPDINSVDDSGDTYLTKILCISLYWDNFRVVERLVALGADVNLPNSRTRITPLQSAIRNGALARPVVDLLLTKGADPHRRDRKGRDALHCATVQTDLWALGRLLQENVDIESIRRDKITVLKYMYKRCLKSIKSHNCQWRETLYCLRAMDMLIKAGAKQSSDADIELLEVLWRAQADMMHAESLRRGVEEIRTSLQDLLWKCSNVDNLRHLCRLKIRTILKFNFRERLQMLCLPGVLCDYILMKDLVDSLSD